MDSPARDAFLVVHAVLWGGSTHTFGRLRAFTLSALWAADADIRTVALRRFLVVVGVANLGPVALLALIWQVLPPDPGRIPPGDGFWSVFGGAFAGLSATAFPRFLHGALASDKRWRRFYPEREWRHVMKQWDHIYRSADPGDYRRANSYWSHVIPGLLLLAVPTGLGIRIAWAAALCRC